MKDSACPEREHGKLYWKRSWFKTNLWKIDDYIADNSDCKGGKFLNYLKKIFFV